MADYDIINAQDTGTASNNAYGDGVHDDRAHLQAWLDDPRQIKFLPAGYYLISGPLYLSSGNRRIFGVGRSASVIKAMSTFTGGPMFNVLDNGGALINGISIDNIGLNGNFNAGTSTGATLGMLIQNVNFSYLTQVAIREVGGTALDLNGLQDCEFRALDVRLSGKFVSDGSASNAPGMYIRNLLDVNGNIVFGTNSLFFSGGDYEQNAYPMVIDGVAAVKFVGSKFHGELPSDDQKFPAAVDLLQLLNGASRIELDACQFSNARRNAIFVSSTTSTLTDNISVRGCTFIEPANYTHTGSDPNPVFTGEAWNINVENGRLIASNNSFVTAANVDTYLHSTDSYTVRGGDIWLQPPQTSPTRAGTLFALGKNEFSNAGHKIKRPGIPQFSTQALDDPFAITDEFITGSLTTSGSIGSLGWSYATGGTVITSRLASIAGHPGILRITTGTTSSISYGLNLCSTASQILDPADYFDLVFVVRNNSVTPMHVTFNLGLYDQTNGTVNPTNGIFIQSDVATQVYGVCEKAGTQTRTTSKLGDRDNNWHTYRMRRASSTQIGFSFDDGPEQFVTANIPTVILNPYIGMYIDDAAAHSLDIDFFRLRTGTNRE